MPKETRHHALHTVLIVNYIAFPSFNLINMPKVALFDEIRLMNNTGFYEALCQYFHWQHKRKNPPISFSENFYLYQDR